MARFNDTETDCAAPAAAKPRSQAGDVASVVTPAGGYAVNEAARVQLEQIQPAIAPGRFLQSWNAETRQLLFGCGDESRGVLVSSGGEVTAPQSGSVRTWLSTSTVERLLNGTPPVTGTQVFTAVQAVLREFIDFDDERLYTLVALWIIGTYLYSMFSHYGYLVFYSAFPRSGKTRTLEIFSHLAFEATQPLNAPTPPAIRETAMEGRTLLLDTLERWREKNAESFSAAMDLLDAGFRNGGMVVKMVSRDAGVWRKESFLVYAPYAMAAIDKDSLTDTALDRAFVVEMHRKSVKVKKRKYTYFSCDKDCLRGVNYFRRLATTISAGQGQQRVSPTTWRYSVVVVGRLVAVENVSAGAPIGA